MPRPVSKRPSQPPKQPAPEPQRANRSRAVAELLPAIGGAAFKRFGFVQSAIVSRWPEIVGERWAGVSAMNLSRRDALRAAKGPGRP